MMSAHLDKLRAKLAALKSKTVEAGCTEAEALAAAEAIARLMAEHGLTDADVETTAAQAEEKTSCATWRTHVASSVAHVTNTAAIYVSHKGGWEFVGRDPWPEVAAYLYQVLVRSVAKETNLFKGTDTYRRRRNTRTRRAATASFTDALVSRLRNRLLELFRSSIDADARAFAHQALSRRYSQTEIFGHKTRVPQFKDAARAGWQAGGRVTISQGVGGAGGPPLQITSKGS